MNSQQWTLTLNKLREAENELAALRLKLAEAEGELATHKQAANAWNALMTGLAAVDELDHEENAEKFQQIDSYIKTWEKQKSRADAAEATHRTCCENEDAARAIAAKVLGEKAQGDSYCVPSVADLMEMVVGLFTESEATALAEAQIPVERLKAIERRGRYVRELEAKLAAVRGELKWAVEQNGGHISASGLLALIDAVESERQVTDG